MERMVLRGSGRRELVTVIALQALLLVPAESGAQANGQRTGESMLFGEIPSVVGASRFEQRVTEAPASVTIITAEEIERQGWRTLGDALRTVRGIFTTSDYHTTYVGVRGFNRPGDFNTRLLLILDGERVNENVFHGAYVGRDGLIDLDLVERIEVIRGPSSSLYGTNAFFGVINVISKRGRDLRGTTVGTEVASFGGTGVRAAWGDRFSSGLEALVSVTRYRSDGPSFYFPEYDDPETDDGLSAIGQDRRNSFLMRMSLGGVTLDATGYEHLSENPTGAWETVFNDPRHTARDWGGQIRLGYETTFDDNSLLSLSTGYHAYDWDGGYPYEDGLYVDWGYGRWWTAESRYVLPIGQHKLVLGAFFQRNSKVDQGAGYDGYELDFASNVDENVWAVFGQDEMRVGPVLVNAGMRYDHYTDFGGTFNPRAALVWASDAGTAIKLLHGTAFRAPNPYERYYNDGGITQKPPSELDPETIVTTELVLERPLGANLRAATSLFHFDVDNLMSLTEDPTDQLLVFDNIGSVTATGAELELEARFGVLDLDASYSFQRLRDVLDDVRPANSPSHVVQLNATAALSEGVRFGFGLRGMSDRIAPNGGEGPAYAVGDLNLLVRDILPGLMIRAGVFNIMDGRIYDLGGEEHLQRLLPQVGRNFRLALDWAF